MGKKKFNLEKELKRYGLEKRKIQGFIVIAEKGKWHRIQNEVYYHCQDKKGVINKYMIRSWSGVRDYTGHSFNKNFHELLRTNFGIVVKKKPKRKKREEYGKIIQYSHRVYAHSTIHDEVPGLLLDIKVPPGKYVVIDVNHNYKVMESKEVFNFLYRDGKTKVA